MDPTHEALLRAVRFLPEGYYPYGQNMDREGDPDMDLARMSDAEVEATDEQTDACTATGCAGSGCGGGAR